MRRLIRRLLTLAVLPEDREGVVGDLEEEYRRLRNRAGRIGAALWYASAAGSTAAWFVLARVGEALSTMTTGGGVMHGWLRDLRHGMRLTLRNPAATTAVVATLALAVGANTAMFSVVHAAFLRDLPYPDGDRLVRIFNGYQGQPDGRAALSPPDWKDVESRPDLVEAVGVYRRASLHLVSADEPIRVDAARASSSLLELLGMTPILGRRFRPQDEVPGQDRSVILSHRLWVRDFGADSSVVGRSVILDDESYQVVGVAPAAFRMPEEAELWVPLALPPDAFGDDNRGNEFLYAVGRLRPGVTPERATRGLSAQLAQVAPDRVERSGQNRSVVDLREYRLGDSGRALLFLLVAVGLVLLVACVNITTLLLARAERRVREFALRRALGSGAAELSRLVLLETLILAVLGGFAGILLAQGLLAFVAQRDWAVLAGIGRIGLSAPAFLFTLALTVATALVFGLGPAARALTASPGTALGQVARGGVGSRRGTTLRHALVTVEVALVVVLLVGVGTSLKSFRALISQDPGFRPQGVLSATLEMPPSLAPGEGRARAWGSILTRVRALPGVESAGLTTALPLTGTVWSGSIELADPTPSTAGVPLGGNMRMASDGYFRTMGIVLEEGRVFGPADVPKGVPVAVVDRTVARKAWPHRSPIGQRFYPAFLETTAFTVVGVVADVRDQGLQTPGSGHIYYYAAQIPPRRATVVVRTGSGDPVSLAPAVTRAIHEVVPRAPVFEVRPLSRLVADSVAGPRLTLELLAAFGLAALLLAAVGVYGVLSYSVAQRTSEIGTRIALGARPGDVVWMVVRQVMGMWLLGTILGLGGALALSSWIRSVAFQVDSSDPILLLAVTGVLGLVALAAGLVPARRAGRIDCLEALRYE